MSAEFALLPLFLILFFLVPLALIKSKFFFWLMFLFSFSGVLFSLDLGFTLKTSQIFALISLVGLTLRFLLHGKAFKVSSLKQYFPFILFTLAITPSLTMAGLSSGHPGYENTLRLFFNFLFLQLILLNIIFRINSKKDLRLALILTLFSYLWVLIFGF